MWGVVDGAGVRGELPAPFLGGGALVPDGAGLAGVVAKVMTIVSVPRWVAGFQEELIWPCGQVACSRSKSRVKRVRSNPALVLQGQISMRPAATMQRPAVVSAATSTVHRRPSRSSPVVLALAWGDWSATRGVINVIPKSASDLVISSAEG